MDKIKKFKKPLIILLAVLAVVCALTVISEATAVRIDGIENYEDIFTDVEKIQYYDGDDNFFTTVSPAKRLKAINRVKIVAEPLYAEISEDRSYRYRIVFNEKYAVYISEDFSELWIDDNGTEMGIDEGRLPSYTYSVRNPGALKKLFY